MGFFRNRARDRRALGGLAGIILLPVAMSLLAWNENRSTAVATGLAEGAVVVRDVPADRVDPALDGKLVHVAGPLAVPGALADPDFPALPVPEGAVQLRRRVETYQWQEVTGRATVSYRQVWSAQPIDSSRFQQPGGPQNPQPRYRELLVVAPEAGVGVRRLGEGLLRTLGGGQRLVPPAEVAAASPGLRLQAGTVYVGEAAGAPQVGDQRLTWEVVRPGRVSVIAQQSGAGFSAYGTGSGTSIFLISPGMVPAEGMIVGAVHGNTFTMWLVRGLGAGLMFLSLLWMLRWVAVLPGVNPTLSIVASEGPAQAAAVLTLVGVLVVIGAAWLWMHPVAGGGVLALGAACIWLIVRRLRARQGPGRP